MWNRIVAMDGGNSLQSHDMYREYLSAGADIIKTTTFMSGPNNAASARIAREAAAEFSPKRFVAGSIGPAGTSADDYFYQACALIEGGVDLLLAETMTGIGKAKMVLQACENAFQEIGRSVPMMLSVTISQDGLLLSGETLEHLCKSVASHKLFSLGINCSFGARHMKPHIKKLSELTSTLVSCHPSAGLPDVSGKYPESPEEWAGIVLEFAERGWADIVGGCCGTTSDHIRALARSAHQIPHATIDLL